MNLRTLPLPAVFATYAILTAAFFCVCLAVRTGTDVGGLWDHPHVITWIVLVVVAVGIATLVTVLESRERQRDDATERARYRKAVASGQPSGDVSRWPEWIQRDRKANTLGWIGVVFLASFGVEGIVKGPQWAGCVLLLLAALCVWTVWRTRNRLQSLTEKLPATAE
jgi:membrane protein implicated in regulation of membrane protease activity